MKLSREFRKLFVPISLSFFLVVLALSAFFIFYMHDKLVATVYQTELRNLREAGEATELLSRQASILARQVRTDYQLKKLLYFEELDTLEEMICMQQLQKYSHSIPSLHSLYLYNEKRDSFFVVSSARIQLIQQREEFYDTEAVRLLHDSEVINSGTPINRQMPGGEGRAYTFLFHDLGKASTPPVSTVVINFSESWLEEQIRRFSFNDRQETIAVNERGEVVLGGPTAPLFSDETAANYVRTVLASFPPASINHGQVEGYSLLNDRGSKELVTHHYRQDIGWLFVRRTPYEDLVRPLQVARNVAIVVVVAFITLSLFVAFLVSRKVYVPLQQAVARTEQLEREQAESSAILTRELLHSYFLEPERAHTSGLRSLQGISFNIDINETVHSVLFSLDPSVHQTERGRFENDERCLRRELDSIRELLEEEYPCETFLFKGGLILTLLNPPPNRQIGEEELRQTAESLVSILARDLNSSFSAVFDPEPAMLPEVAAALTELEDAAQYRLIFGPGACIDMREIRWRKAIPFEMLAQEENRLAAAVHQRDHESAASVCSSVLRRAAETTHDAVRNSAIRLISIIHDAANRVAGGEGAASSLSFSELLHDAAECSSISELEGFFNSLLTAVEKESESDPEDRRNEIVLAVRRVVRNEYSDPNLSSALIAEELGLSAPYTGRVFKEVTGSSLPDFINAFRTDKAKELLLTTELSIRTILERTGYNSTSHFYSVFRKLNGTTPTSFRWKQRPVHLQAMTASDA